MDPWTFYDITHRDLVVCNPTSIGKLDEVIGLLDLPPEPSVLDIACGKGEPLVRMAETYGGAAGAGFHGVGVDLSPFCVAQLRASAAERVPNAAIEALEMDGAAYRATAGAFDLACCLGASWVFGGYRETLRALTATVRPGGLVLVGEPFWQSEPDPAYLAWADLRDDSFLSHAGNVERAAAEGLTPLLALTSDTNDWDRYETFQWRAAARYAAATPDDPDVPGLLDRVGRTRHEYLTWGRATLGWSLYLFALPG